MPISKREKQARGWGIGVFVGLACPPGTHFFIALPLALKCKGSAPAALAGVFVTNPLTALFIYPLQTWIGDRILGGTFDFATLKLFFRDLERLHDPRTIFSLGGDMLLAFCVGGFVLAVPAALAVYWSIHARKKPPEKRKSGSGKNAAPASLPPQP